MRGATVRADYVATEGSYELSISIGDQLWVCSEQPEGGAEHGWCAVVRSAAADEQPGLVPIDYLELRSDDTASPPAVEHQPPPQEQQQQQQLSAWLTDAISTAAVTANDHGVALDAIALADFEPASAAELRLAVGERVLMLLDCEAPEGWAVALKRVAGTADENESNAAREGDDLAAVPGGERTSQGLVPAAYLSLLPFEATVTATQRLDADAHDADAAADADGASLAVQRGERVMVQPSRSTPSCWWAQRYLPKVRLWQRYDASAPGGGAAGLSPGEEGLVPRSCLAPVPSRELREALRREAHLLNAEAVIGRAVMVVGMARRHRRRRVAARLVQRCWRGGGAARVRARRMRQTVEEAAKAAAAHAAHAAEEAEGAEAAAAEERRSQQRQQQAKLPRRRRPSDRLDEERAAAAFELEREGEAGSESSRDSSPSFGGRPPRGRTMDSAPVLLGPVDEAPPPAAANAASAAIPPQQSTASQHAAGAATRAGAVAAARVEVARQVRAAEARLSASLADELRAASSRRAREVQRRALELSVARRGAAGGAHGGAAAAGLGKDGDGHGDVVGRASRVEARLRMVAAEAREAEERAAAAERLVRRASATLQAAARDVRTLRKHAGKADAAVEAARQGEVAMRGALGRAQQRNASLSVQLAAAAERVARLQQGRQMYNQ